MSATIGSLIARDLDKRIEEIIKVNNADEETVYAELTEYIATDRIKTEYERLFRAMADAPKTPNADVGVWISGARRFIGSRVAREDLVLRNDGARGSVAFNFLRRWCVARAFPFDVRYR